MTIQLMAQYLFSRMLLLPMLLMLLMLLLLLIMLLLLMLLLLLTRPIAQLPQLLEGLRLLSNPPPSPAQRAVFFRSRQISTLYNQMPRPLHHPPVDRD
jgi:hypothetical protein